MVPKIIISDSDKKIQEWLKENTQGFLLSEEILPEKKSISINQIKNLIKRVSLSSGKNECFLFLIHNANLMTIPAQNSILKLLEEVKQNQLIVLTTNNLHQLLPTIISRCQVVNLIVDNYSKDLPSLNPPLRDWGTDPDKIILLTDEIIKVGAPEYFQYSLKIIRNLSLQKPDPNRTQILKNLAVLVADLSGNINPKLAIDHFFFTIRKYLKTS